MSDTEAANSPPSPAPAPASDAPRRGRPPRSEPETPEARVFRLQRELQAAEQAVAERLEKQASIVGAAVIAHARQSPEFARQLADILRARVTRKNDLGLIGELLA